MWQQWRQTEDLDALVQKLLRYVRTLEDYIKVLEQQQQRPSSSSLLNVKAPVFIPVSSREPTQVLLPTLYPTPPGMDSCPYPSLPTWPPLVLQSTLCLLANRSSHPSTCPDVHKLLPPPLSPIFACPTHPPCHASLELPKNDDFKILHPRFTQLQPFGQTNEFKLPGKPLPHPSSRQQVSKATDTCLQGKSRRQRRLENKQNEDGVFAVLSSHSGRLVMDEAKSLEERRPVLIEKKDAPAQQKKKDDTEEEEEEEEEEKEKEKEKEKEEKKKIQPSLPQLETVQYPKHGSNFSSIEEVRQMLKDCRCHLPMRNPGEWAENLQKRRFRRIFFELYRLHMDAPDMTEDVYSISIYNPVTKQSTVFFHLQDLPSICKSVDGKSKTDVSVAAEYCAAYAIHSMPIVYYANYSFHEESPWLYVSKIKGEEFSAFPHALFGKHYVNKSPVYTMYIGQHHVATLDLNDDNRTSIVKAAIQERNRCQAEGPPPSAALIRMAQNIFIEEDLREYCAYLCHMYLAVIWMRLKQLYVMQAYDTLFENNPSAIRFAHKASVIRLELLQKLLDVDWTGKENTKEHHVFILQCRKLKEFLAPYRRYYLLSTNTSTSIRMTSPLLYNE